MTKQELNRVNNLLNNYSWKAGAWEVATLKGLLKREERGPQRLHDKHRKLLNIIETRAKGLAREHTRAEAKHNKSHKRHARQLAAMRSGR